MEGKNTTLEEENKEKKEGEKTKRVGWARVVPLGVCRYISGPLSGTRQKGCRAERKGGSRGREKEKKEARGRFNNFWWREEAAGAGGKCIE